MARVPFVHLFPLMPRISHFPLPLGRLWRHPQWRLQFIIKIYLSTVKEHHQTLRALTSRTLCSGQHPTPLLFIHLTMKAPAISSPALSHPEAETTVNTHKMAPLALTIITLRTPASTPTPVVLDLTMVSMGLVSPLRSTLHRHIRLTPFRLSPQDMLIIWTFPTRKAMGISCK